MYVCVCTKCVFTSEAGLYYTRKLPVTVTLKSQTNTEIQAVYCTKPNAFIVSGAGSVTRRFEFILYLWFGHTVTARMADVFDERGPKCRHTRDRNKV